MGEKTETARRRGVRLLGQVLAFLFAGFIVQTLVPFGIAIFGPSHVGIGTSRVLPTWMVTDRAGGPVSVEVDSSCGVYVARVTPLDPLGSDVGVPFLFPTIRNPHPIPSWVVFLRNLRSDSVTTLAFGWPLPSWYGVEIIPLGGTGVTGAGPSLLKGFGPGYRHPLPTRPIVRNSIANAGAHGVAIGLPWWLVRTLRRLRRRRASGTCPHCGYALAGLPAATPCPECGTSAATPR